MCDFFVCLQEPRQGREALVLCGEGQRAVMGVLPPGSLWCGLPDRLGVEEGVVLPEDPQSGQWKGLSGAV